MIRGYGHVKEEHMKEASVKREQLLEIWNSKKKQILREKILILQSLIILCLDRNSSISAIAARNIFIIHYKIVNVK